MMTIYFDVKLIFLVTCIALSLVTQIQCSLKTQVENVPGIIFPVFIGRVCMRRKAYDCRWTYEKSCNCNPLRPKNLRRIIDITFVRVNTKEMKNLPTLDVDKCDAGDDKRIKF